MDRVTAYDEDIYAWSREQADALRRLAAGRSDLPNELDVCHIAEEIEDVGSSELFRVESFLELLLRHLLKLASAPDAAAADHWRVEIDVHRRALARHYRPSMRQRLDLDDLWRTARGRAAVRLAKHGDALLADLPLTCPFGVDELVDDRLDEDTALGRLRDVRPPG